MPVNSLKKLTIFATLTCLILLTLLLAPLSRAGSPKAAPPAPPAAVAPPDPPTPPETPPPPRGWLGVVLSDEEGEGVVVTEVREDSPAEKAGLQEGDRILELDGNAIPRIRPVHPSPKVESSRDVRRFMRNLEPGDTVQIRIKRKSLEKTVTATVGKPPEDGLFRSHGWFDEGTPAPMAFGMPGMSRSYLGVRVQSMTEDLRAYFKAPRGRGLLVSRVEEDTPAARAGLRAGDVIIAVGGKGISDRSDIAQALSDHEAGDRVAVKIVRDGSEKTLDVEIAERTGSGRHGAIFLPEDGVLDLERIEMLPEGIDQTVQESLDKARQELQRAMREAPDKKQQLAAALRKTHLTDERVKAIHQQVEEAMDRAREELHHATEAMKDSPI